ncbi:hypothetical protein K461DRAFT_300309 [Myriangium duriaei CBS 260.36]|uniref:F-box domain-containing protein n=1 Tax=Myriangium duriaei CBS 260.36 TaxID=1168546 RepID=A0A9P4MEC9_9PEZI|nr:hypothetical protein K461DRAFT_300309 [Myriangium duriaei CBS 260.36]
MAPKRTARHRIRGRFAKDPPSVSVRGNTERPVWRTVHHLPPELMCAIFGMLLEPEPQGDQYEWYKSDRLKTLLRVRCVCRNWRAIIRSSSILQAQSYLVSPRSEMVLEQPQINPLLLRFVPAIQMKLFEVPDSGLMGWHDLAHSTSSDPLVAGDWVISMHIRRNEFEPWLKKMHTEWSHDQGIARLVPSCIHMRFATRLVDTLTVTAMEGSEFVRMRKTFRPHRPWPRVGQQARQHIVRLQDHEHCGLGEPLSAVSCPILGGEHNCCQYTENGVTMGMLIAVAKRLFAEKEEPPAGLNVFMRLSNAN